MVSFDAASPGCAVGIAEGGRTLLAKGYGLASLEHREPLSPRSAFYMASVSKQFMAFAILLLAEQRRLNLDDSVRKYIPELPAYADAITIRHLLHHTSGLRDYLALGSLAGYSLDHVWTDRAARRMIARQNALNFAPGAEYLYSNSGYVMLSWIAEAAAGRRLQDWSREKIFGPLGMASTRWQQNHADPVPGRATGHIRAADSGAGWRIANSMLDVVGDGGLYSTVEDMLKWNANFESPAVGAGALVVMQTPGKLRDGSAIASGYGMGLAKGAYRGLETVSHGGGLQGYRTYFLRFPAQKLGVVVLCNNATANPARLAERIAEVHLGDRLTAPAPAPPKPNATAPAKLVPVTAAEAQALAGQYFSEELSAFWRIEPAGEGAQLFLSDLPPSPLFQGADGGIRVGSTGVSIRPQRDDSGAVLGFTAEVGRVRGMEFTRR